jgi:8-oxo-dGTP pyrophosphatase MutT (NUDIX family)
MPTRSPIGEAKAAPADAVGEAKGVLAARFHPQAAALPWRQARQGIEVLLVTSSGGRRWVVPKGWPLAGESLADAAAREAWEEGGVQGRIAPAALGQFVHVKASPVGPPRACLVSLFAMGVVSLAERWPEQGRRQRVWMSLAEAAACMRQAELAAMISGFTPTGRHDAGML